MRWGLGVALGIGFLGLAALLTNGQIGSAPPGWAPKSETLERNRSAVATGLGWLWGQQGADGLLRAPHYANLRRGESITAAALLATSWCPAELQRPHGDATARAFAALARGSQRDAAIDYPCYAVASELHALIRLAPNGWSARAEACLARLRQLQFSAANGWRVEDPAFGGFGLGDGPPATPEAQSLVTLATTVTAIAAARAAGLPVADPLIRDARTFVERCQQEGGGFVATPGGEWRGGKGGASEQGGKRAYGTATADGVRGLLLTDAEPERIRAALLWLGAAHPMGIVRGLLPEFEPSLRFYHAAALGEIADELGAEPHLHWLRERQREDGAFVGFAGAMKEDEPVVATILAIRALAPR